MMEYFSLEQRISDAQQLQPFLAGGVRQQVARAVAAIGGDVYRSATAGGLIGGGTAGNAEQVSPSMSPASSFATLLSCSCAYHVAGLQTHVCRWAQGIHTELSLALGAALDRRVRCERRCSTPFRGQGSHQQGHLAQICKS